MNRFLPEGYTPLSQLALPPISIELPPPQVGRRHTIESEKSDEVDRLTCAMEQMTFDVTPHEMDGSEEPSLRPIRVGKFEDDVPPTTTQPMRILNSRAVSRDDQSILPSLYFEMAIAYYDKKLTNDDELDGYVTKYMCGDDDDAALLTWIIGPLLWVCRVCMKITTCDWNIGIWINKLRCCKERQLKQNHLPWI